MSFGLRLVWLGVILFFFWKLVQKVQELIRPGVASIGPNLAGDVQRRTVGGAKTVTRAATRSTVGMGAGVIAAGQRRRMMAADPTRGPIRRTAGTLLSPATLLAGGIRGAVLGPQDAHRRSYKTMGKAQVNAVTAANAANSSQEIRSQGSPTVTAAGSAARTARTAGTPNLNVRTAGSSHGTARDAAAVGPVLPRRQPQNPGSRVSSPRPAGQPAAAPAGPWPAPPAANTETVSLPRAPVPHTDHIPRPPTQTERIPRPAPDPGPPTGPFTKPGAQPPVSVDADNEPARRPLESTSTGQA